MSQKCNLIIDSCCDLPYEVVHRPDVDLIRFPYVIDDTVHEDDLYQSVSAHEFFEGMRNGSEPSTAQIAMSTLQDAFTRAVESGIPTVYLCFSSGLSGSYDVAELVLGQIKEKHPQAEIYLVDTRLAAIAEGLLVYEAIKQVDKGMSAAELKEWAEEAKFYVNALFMVDDLESLRRGGRIPSSIAYAGAKLDVKPMLTIDAEGKLTLSGVARGRKKGLKQLAEFFQKNAAENGMVRSVAISNADCPKDVERLQEYLSKADEGVLFLESSVGPVIGSHVGPGMIAVVFWGKDRREALSVADKIARKVKGN